MRKDGRSVRITSTITITSTSTSTTGAGNCNIREIQELLGHNHVETTMIYTHVMRQNAPAVRSPLDAVVA